MTVIHAVQCSACLPVNMQTMAGIGSLTTSAPCNCKDVMIAW